MLHHKFDHLFQAITANMGVLSVVWITNLNQILQLILLLSSVGFAIVKWVQHVKENRKRKRKSIDN